MASLKEQVERMCRAFMREDFETLLDTTYPGLVELMGGRETMRAALRATADELRAGPAKIVSYEAGEPGEVKSAGAQLYSLVPTDMKTEHADAFYTVRGFVMGISEDGGKVWTLIDVTMPDEEALKLIVPEIAEVLTLPEPGPPVVEKKP
ncbi:MAG TPA: hypothetical protein VFS10_16960 [Pyrinomonadaceae bacterium]|nr:hypothetical protein [Pyrinomonadaceae bacterium]